MIYTPLHGTLPSGHATEAFISAIVLWHVLAAAGRKASPKKHGTPYNEPGYMRGLLEQLVELAARIATNRTIAGVHFPVDNVAGAVLGLALGEYLVASCGTKTTDLSSFSSTTFDGSKYPMSDPALPEGMVTTDLDPDVFLDFDALCKTAVSAGNGLKSQTPFLGYTTVAADSAHSSMLAWLWGKATSEWILPKP